MSTRPTRTVEHRPAAGDLPPLELVRSSRRRRTASAYAKEGRIVVQLPAGLPEGEEGRLITELVRKTTGKIRAEQAGGDDALAARARELAATYLDGIEPTSVVWSGRMQRRYGSCTPADGTIRISRRLAAFPAYVRDYVLVHELTHLLVPDHSPAFHALVDRFPDAGRARGFLEGVRFAEARAGLPTHELE